MDDALYYPPKHPLALAALNRLPTHDEYCGWTRAVGVLEWILIYDPPYTEDGRRILVKLLEDFMRNTTLYCQSHIEK